MPRELDNMPPVRRPGAGVGEHFPVNDPRSSRRGRPPDDVIDAVERVLVKARRPLEQREIARRLRRELGRELSDASYDPYTSKALGVLHDEGRAQKVGERPAEWQAGSSVR